MVEKDPEKIEEIKKKVAEKMKPIKKSFENFFLNSNIRAYASPLPYMEYGLRNDNNVIWRRAGKDSKNFFEIVGFCLLGKFCQQTHQKENWR